MKILGLLIRRQDLSRAQFADYYEAHHAPLASTYLPWRKYVRNHLISSTPDDPGFDCLGEFWIDRMSELGKVLAGPLGTLFAHDEANFMRLRPADAEGWASTSTARSTDAVEHLLAGEPRGIDPSGARKEALLLKRAPAVERGRFLGEIQSWGRALFAQAPSAYRRLTLDEVLAEPGEVDFPADAVVSGWLEADSGLLLQTQLPQVALVLSALRIESHETPPAELVARFDRDSSFTYPVHWLTEEGAHPLAPTLGSHIEAPTRVHGPD